MQTVVAATTCNFCIAQLPNTHTKAADRFGVDRLKKLCEQEMLRVINTGNAAHILYAADFHNAEVCCCCRGAATGGLHKSTTRTLISLVHPHK